MLVNGRSETLPLTRISINGYEVVRGGEIKAIEKEAQKFGLYGAFGLGRRDDAGGASLYAGSVTSS